MKKFVLLLIILSFLSCKKDSKETGIEIKQNHKTQKRNVWESMSFEEQVRSIKNNTPEDSITSNDISYINDSILRGKFKLDISKYQHDNKKNKCYPIRFSKKIILEFHNEGFKNLGDLNGDKKEDSVFVLQNFKFL